MASKKATPPAPQTPPRDAVEEIKELDILTDSLLKATEDAPPDDKKTLDFAALAKTVDDCIETIKSKQAGINRLHLEQLPLIVTMGETIQTVWDVWAKKTTTPTTKKAILAAFPSFETCRNATDAIYDALKRADMGLTTAKNVWILARKPHVATHAAAQAFSVTVAYDLARTDLTDSDVDAAALAGLTVANVDSWIDARRAAKTIKAQWPVFATARAETRKYDAQAKAQPQGTAGALEARDLLEKSTKHAAEANVAWTAITDARAVIAKSLFPDALTVLDSDVETAVAAEESERAESEKAQAEKANDDAAARAQKLLEDAKAKAEKATALDTRRAVFVDTARQLSDEIDAKKKALETAEHDAVETLRKELAELNRQSTQAQADMEKAQAEADTAKAEADTAKAKADLALKTATKTAEKAGKPAPKPATATVTRPTASTYDDLNREYNRMTAAQLREQMADIATALWKRGVPYMADWVSHGAALDAGLIEPNEPKPAK